MAWYTYIDNYLVKLGFTRNNFNPNLYLKIIQDMPMIWVLYVGNIFLTFSEQLLGEVGTHKK